MTDTPIPQQIADVYFDDIRAARTREPAFYDAVWEIANDLEAADEISEVEFDAALDAAMDLIRNATVTITYADGDAPHAITKVRPRSIRSHVETSHLGRYSSERLRALIDGADLIAEAAAALEHLDNR